MKYIRKLFCKFNFHKWKFSVFAKENERRMYIGSCQHCRGCCLIEVTYNPLTQRTRYFYDSIFVDSFDTGWRD